MNRTRIIVMCIAVGSLALGHFFFRSGESDVRRFLPEVAPGEVFSARQGRPPHYASESGIVAWNTHEVVPAITGYAGPIKVLLAMDPEGSITGIRIIEHRETKNYVHYLMSPEYLGRFLGKSVHDPFEIDRDIDAISRATVSVEALARTVRESSRIIAEQVMGIEVKHSVSGLRRDQGVILYAAFFAGAFILYLLSRSTKRLLRVRDIVLAAAIPVVGLYLSAPVSILHVMNLALLRFSASLLWYGMLLSLILSVILAGRFYCGWICPFGAMAEFIGRLPFRKWRIPAGTDDAWRNLKYIVLAAVIPLVFLSGHVEYGNYETYVTLFSFHGSAPAWILVIAMLVINIRVPRFWCRFLCPVAAFTGMLSRRMRGYPSTGDCPMANRPDPLPAECIRCNRCYTGSGRGTERPGPAPGA